MNRRDFLKGSTFSLATLMLSKTLVAGNARKPIRFGMITDLHYANIDANNARYYKQSLAKLKEFVSVMNQEGVDFVIELGDFKDQDYVQNSEHTKNYLRTIENEFQNCKPDCYHVLGNHDMDSLTKDEFLDTIENAGYIDAFPYYSFTKKGIHFIVLDSTYSQDGTSYNNGNFSWDNAFVSQEQLGWLRKDLGRYQKPTVVFIHHPLVTPGEGNEMMCPRNADEVRNILEESGNVMAVFSGHHHAGYQEKLKGIHYYTLKSVVDGNGVENNNYAIVEIDLFKGLEITGFRNTENCSLNL